MIKELQEFTLDHVDKFWELNPQMALYDPFSKLYKRDNSKNKTTSSKEMWYIVFMSDPDEKRNIFYRMSPESRSSMLAKNFDIDINEDNLIEECLEIFPQECLTAIQRVFKEEIDTMRNRARFLVEFDYSEATLDEILKVDKIKGLTLKLADNYEKIEKKFLDEKNQAHVKGGSKLTKREELKYGRKIS